MGVGASVACRSLVRTISEGERNMCGRWGKWGGRVSALASSVSRWCGGWRRRACALEACITFDGGVGKQLK